MRYVSIFSGVEAATLAWEPLGWEPVAFSEIEPFPCAVLAERWPDVPNLGDITKIDWKKEIHGSVDLVVGGSPCQSFSIAGKREGLKGASGLMFEYIRCVQELRPRWFLWENVPGALTSENGDAFGQLLREMDELGYCLAWRVLDAQFFGVAQRRRRVFLVGSLGDRRAADVLFEPESLRWDSPSSREKREALTGGASGVVGACSFCLQGSMIGRSDNAGPQGRGINEELSFTLNTIDRHVVAIAANQRGELRYDGVDGSTVGAIPATRSGKQIQAVVCMMGDHGKAAVDVGVAGTLTAHDAKGAPSIADGYTVRRLTPLECERLQGFPDGHTLIAWKCKPAEECPDGPRYKAIGNSMAVPVMRWLGERIEAADRL